MTAPKDIAAQAREAAQSLESTSGCTDADQVSIELAAKVLRGIAASLDQPDRAEREAAQRERIAEVFSGRATTPATADFDLIAPNDAQERVALTDEQINAVWCEVNGIGTSATKEG